MEKALMILLTICSMIAYILIDTKHALHIFQQNRYELFRYTNWLKGQKADREELILWLLQSLPWLLLFCLSKNNWLSVVLLAVLLQIATFLKFKAEQRKNYIKPLHVTGRVKRQMVTVGILYCLLFGIIFFFLPVRFYALLAIVAPILPWLFVYPVFYLNEPAEQAVKNHFLNEAKKILADSSQLIKVGITGSYGKTSTKNIVQAVLSGKYYSLMTPASFNTPMGITITIREQLKPLHELFVCEMGADKVGEIDYLTKFVQPQYGIVTSIGPQHLNTFGSLDNIIQEKMKMIENLPATGVGFLNIDNPYIRNYQVKNSCKLITYGIEQQADYRAEEIQYSSHGSSFTVLYQNERYPFTTRLLGAHNVMNILVSIALARELSVSWEALQKAVAQIEKIEHRLELKKINGYTFIDNAFNSNPEGSAMSLNVLATMPGRRYIVTPGMIDLGAKQDEANYHFGSLMKNQADEVILVGPKQTKPIYEGLLASGFLQEDIHVVNTVKEAFALIYQIATPEDTILLENDLPDAFNQ